MRTLAACAVLVAFAFTCAPIEAQTIERYVETLDLDGDGNGHVATTIGLSAGPGTIVNIPVAAPGRPVRPSVRGGTPASASVVTAHGRTSVSIVLPAAPSAPVVLELSYELERAIDFGKAPLAYGNRRLRYEFVNTTGASVKDFTGTVLLPPGMVMSSVDQVAPARAETAAGSPFTLDTRNGRSAVTVSAATLALGDRAAATVLLKPSSSPIPLLGVLALMAAVYLYRFRDLVRPPAS